MEGNLIPREIAGYFDDLGWHDFPEPIKLTPEDEAMLALIEESPGLSDDFWAALMQLPASAMANGPKITYEAYKLPVMALKPFDEMCRRTKPETWRDRPPLL